MRVVDIIQKKRDGRVLTEDEISFLVQGYAKGEIPDYQVAAFLMAVYFRGLDAWETGVLTREMIASGGTIDLSTLEGPFVDKHSTGGVGDKVSLILAPIVAACGVHVPMMSGRSLGHTGGTLDKLESIPGYTIARDEDAFRRILADVGFAMTGQSERIAPADRLLYALRDVTGTVESVPLITGSILSKKFAEGADALVFDVKCGRGAFMKDQESASALATSLVRTGSALDKKIVACITRMDEPLGYAVGNFLEAEESLYCLKPELAPNDWSAPKDLMEVTLRLSAWMCVLSGIVGGVEEGVALCTEKLESGEAHGKFVANVESQSGDYKALESQLGSRRGRVHEEVQAKKDGFIHEIDAYAYGIAGIALGAGRASREDKIRPDTGFLLRHKIGDSVSAGETLADLYADDTDAAAEALEIVNNAYRIEADPPGAAPSPASSSVARPPSGGRGFMILDEVSSS